MSRAPLVKEGADRYFDSPEFNKENKDIARGPVMEPLVEGGKKRKISIKNVPPGKAYYKDPPPSGSLETLARKLYYALPYTGRAKGRRPEKLQHVTTKRVPAGSKYWGPRGKSYIKKGPAPKPSKGGGASTKAGPVHGPHRPNPFKVRGGQGYAHLAAQINKKYFKGKRVVTSGALRKRMGRQILHTKREYVFTPEQFAKGTSSDLSQSAGITKKQVLRSAALRRKLIAKGAYKKKPSKKAPPKADKKKAETAAKAQAAKTKSRAAEIAKGMRTK